MASPNDPNPRIPVFSMTGAAFSMVTGNLGLLFRAALPFLVLSILIFVGFNVWVGTAADLSKPDEVGKFMQSHIGDMVLFILVALFAYTVTFVSFCTKWYRFTLRWPELDPIPVDIRWYKQDWAFLGYGLLMFLIVLAAYWTLAGGLGVALSVIAAQGGAPSQSVIGTIVGVNAAVLILMFMLIVRYGFVFPAVSAGVKTSLATSWRQTKGNWGRLILLLIVFMLLSLVIGILAQLLMLGFRGVFGGMGFAATDAALYATALAQVIANVANIVYLGAAISAHGLAYRHVEMGDVMV